MNSRTKLLSPVLTAIGAGVLLVSGAAFAAPAMENSEVNSASGQTRSQLIHSSASVESIDRTDRSVLLKTSDGTENWIHVPESVQAFDSLKVGDKVNVDYYQSLAVSMAPSGTKPSMTTSQAGAVDLGAGIQSREFKLSAKVVGVDTDANTVTFKGPKGRAMTVTVENAALRAKLPTLKPGQVVQFDYTEAVAADIRPASK